MAKVTGILGKKVGMTQLFDSKGDVHPATVLQAGPCVVTQHKTQTKDGYDCAQIGLVEFMKESKLSQPERGHLAKNNVPPVKFIREVPIEADGDAAVKAGDRVLIDLFEGEKFVDVVGVRWREVTRVDVSDYRLDWFIGVSVARVQGHANVGAYGQCAGDGSQPASAGRRER